MNTLLALWAIGMIVWFCLTWFTKDSIVAATLIGLALTSGVVASAALALFL